MGSWLTAGVGGERIEHRDRRVSPTVSAGLLGRSFVGVERLGTRTMFDANIEYGGGDLTSLGNGSSERLDVGRADVALQLRLRRNLFAGLEVGLRAEEIVHSYPRTLQTESFDALWSTLSPVVTWMPAWRERTVHVRASVAALALVNRPYSRSQAGASRSGIAGPTTLASGAIEVSRLFRERSRVSWRLAGRVGAWSHRSDAGAAGIEGSASVGGRVRLGSMQ